MSGVEIRRATPGDAPTIAELHIRSFRSAYAHLPLTARSAESGLAGRVAFWEDRLRGSEGSTFVAEDETGIVGFVHFGPSPDDDAEEMTGHIFSVHIDPDLTGKGIGRQLVDVAVSSLSEQGYRAVTLWVVADNARAHRFYSGLGWRTDGAARTEKLAVGEEEGNVVEVIRFSLDVIRVAEQA
jgi:ribosomal protein S18 acetylase RimI-like enzyme